VHNLKVHCYYFMRLWRLVKDLITHQDQNVAKHLSQVALPANNASKTVVFVCKSHYIIDRLLR
jgi:hypothetical protein